MSTPTRPTPTHPAPSSNPLPIQFTALTKKDFSSDGGVAFFNQQLSQIVTTINALLGSGGPTILPSGIDVAGAKVTGLAAPTGPSDAVSAGHASANYSASAVSPQLDVGGSSALKGLTYLFLQTYVNKILAGAGITISPVAGTGIVRISATGVGVGNFIFGEQVAGGPLSWLLGNVPAVDANGNPAVQLFSGTAAIWRGGGLDYTLPPSSKAITTNYAITGGTLWANYLLP